MKNDSESDACNPNSHIPEKSAKSLTKDHRAHLKNELGIKGLKAAIKYGAHSIDEEEARTLGFRLRDKSGNTQYSSGLILPFLDGYGQLRCDKKLYNEKGEISKYLNPAGKKANIMIFGEGQPKYATEGWKDALSIHVNTGETVVAIPGVHSWKLLPESVELIIYNADASQNPQVWGPLVEAGLERKGLNIAFFPEAIAGAKGGACEFFKNGGEWENVDMYKPKEFLQELPNRLRRDIKTNWIKPTLAKIGRLAYLAYGEKIAAEKLLERAGKIYKVTKRERDNILDRAISQISSKRNKYIRASSNSSALTRFAGSISPKASTEVLEPEEATKEINKRPSCKSSLAGTTT